MKELVLFVSTFVLVFLMGLQSQNVNGGHYLAAFFTSFGVGIGNLILFKMVPDASFSETMAFLSGGPLGIVSSMWAHKRMKKFFFRLKTKRLEARYVAKH